MRTIAILLASALGMLSACQRDTPAAATAPAAAGAAAATSNAAASTTGGQEIRLKLEGIVCEGCVQSAEQALKRVDGVREASVSFEHRIATIRADPGVTPELLASALEKAEMNGRQMHFKATVVSP